MNELSIKSGFSNVGVCPLTPLDSARLLPCASSFSEEVVEGTHHIIAEGTGLEPYSPCQGLVRGQGGLQDVQCRVVLSIHFPVTYEAHEILAHPISAPSATHGAGLTGPCRIDLDDGHAPKGGLVFDLAMNLPVGPRRKATVDPTRFAVQAGQFEVLENDCGLRSQGELNKTFADEMESLFDPAPFSCTLPRKKSSLNSSILGFSAR